TAEELARFEHHFSELLPQCSVVTISGSLPIGCSTQFYCGLIHKAKQMGKKVLLDTSGKALVAAATAKPTLIKPNVDEIKALVTADVQTPAQAAQAAQQLHSTGIAYVVLSLGCKGAIMACDSGVFYAEAASVKAVNAVGCGDSMLAGLAVGLLHNESPSDCLRMGMAAGAANALTFGTGCVEKAKYEALLTQIKVRDFYENPLTCR
ncbi:MAG: PfkB family carbohydrate kinase, partial [Ruthenibacterium sp.]